VNSLKRLRAVSISINRKRVIMVVDDQINQALNRIADNQEEMNETLKRIANHYDGVVPVMTRNAKRVEKAHEEAEDSLEQSLGAQIKGIFNPQAN